MMHDQNGCMPVNRRSLLDYMENGNLTYITRAGVSVAFEEAELTALWSVSSELEKMKLKLPIIIGTDTSGPSGTWKVDGTPEVSIIQKILGKSVRNVETISLYHPDIKDLRKILPNLAIFVFIQ